MPIAKVPENPTRWFRLYLDPAHLNQPSTRKHLHNMKTTIEAAVIALAGVLTLHTACAAPAVLELQKAPGVLGPWQKLPASTLPITADGALLDAATSNASFYRLAISKTDSAGGPIAIALSDAPTGAVAVASEFLQSSPVPEWFGVTLGSVAYPLYNPAINGGTNPAYMEFKVILMPASYGTNSSGFATSPPDGRPSELGWMIVSLTDQDGPVLEFGTDSVSKTEQLRRRAGTFAVRMFRYDEDFMAAEGNQGRLVASLGTTPFRPPSDLLKYIGADFPAEISSNVVVVVPPQPALTGTPYGSYAEFKADYVNGAVYSTLRSYRTTEAQMRWGFRQGTGPAIIPVTLGDWTPILPGTSVARVELDNTLLATVTVPTNGSGVRVFGVSNGVTLMRVFGTDLSSSNYILAVANTNGGGTNMLKGGGLSFSWGPWQTYYAGNQGNQRCYDQVFNLAGCCPNGWSGCGATAWAMLYGYWGVQGVPNLMGTGTPPPYNTADVSACIQYEFPHIFSFCLNNGQAGTLPPTMWLGYQWAPARGRGISGTLAWGLPYVSAVPRLLAINSIVNDHRPAIIGTGFYEHYPLAWGYAYRTLTATLTWWWFGWHSSSWVVSTDQSWITNDGQGNCSPVWVSTSSCWYGTDLRCY